ncbi:MAG: hypothetical protein PF518_01720 [Spirochaetaceae bacterium]|jgi:hypothetical protein|nr:hypothetical protein [Spirochaetaceae bacterium]
MGLLNGLFGKVKNDSKGKNHSKKTVKILSEEDINKKILEFRDRLANIKNESCNKQCSLSMDMILDEKLGGQKMIELLEALFSRYEMMDKECQKTDAEIERMEADLN